MRSQPSVCWPRPPAAPRRDSGASRLRVSPALLALLAVAASVAIALFGLGWLGYLGGDAYHLVPAAGHARPPATAAVLLSGDMGTRVGMAPRLARRLANDGIPVLEVNSLTLFARRRTPAEVDTIIADAARRALAASGAAQLLLIGQSFGADMLQLGASRLPPELRRRVRLIALIVPGDTVQFRASPSEIFDFGEATHAALATAQQLDWAPLVCIYGVAERRSLCPRLALANAKVVALPGGHLMDRNVDRLYAALWSAIVAAGNLQPQVP